MNITTPWEVDIDGTWGEAPSMRLGGAPHPIRYIGKARRQLDGTYRVLAQIFEALCVVEVRLRF